MNTFDQRTRKIDCPKRLKIPVLLIAVVMLVVANPALNLFASREALAEKAAIPKLNEQPTFITADTLTLDSGNRIFTYSGNVVVLHGDMTLNARRLTGKYSEDNKVTELLAVQDVVIVRPPGLRATAQRALYDAAKQTVVLTENPEVEQDGSVLASDKITIFLEDNRSVAEGQVRVRLVPKEGGKP